MRDANAVVVLLLGGYAMWLGVLTWSVHQKQELPAPEVEAPELVLPPPMVVGECEVAYGPVPTPRAGWQAWGLVCPKGVEP